MLIPGHCQLIDFQSLLQAAEREQKALDELEERIARFAMTSALEKFDLMKTLSADELVEFCEGVNRLAAEFASLTARVARSAGTTPPDAS